MKILVISDTHGITYDAERIVKKYEKNIVLCVHLGDLVKDAVYLQNKFPNLKFEIVRGNNDFTRDFPSEKIIEVGNKKILITHGHMYSVKSTYDLIVNHAKSFKVDAVFFGHTHQQEEFYSDNVLFLNPGSIALSRDGSRSYAIAEVTPFGVVAYLEKV
ncbi:metallophosphoesterase [Caldicellulosiruptor changbaiensis]|uniref:Phosphoesterase n=1 Tax=Caldicellulosiruptor changbaiensis TaxID=1222016 RepID=A0A3T0D755_9FIRM|nr:metallophosphoesterase [Caldicellulosiruptor changbaiensis]AZT90940.1 metallophosphoesterase [Caldicellulosiruptor changbaiensis]